MKRSLLPTVLSLPLCLGQPLTATAPPPSDMLESGEIEALRARRGLTDADFREVASRLGVEVAVLKAVVEIETGRTNSGLTASGQPVVNFDFSMFRRRLEQRGLRIGNYSSSHPDVFREVAPSRQDEVYARLEKARTISSAAADEATFWGMFQIGGFNWKRCGCDSLDDFVELMSRSERDQLELFASFVINTGLDKMLQAKEWTRFAAAYNGPAYARQSYHTRLAGAYRRIKAKEVADVAKTTVTTIDTGATAVE